MKKSKLFSLGMLAALLAFGLVPAGCDNPAGKPDDGPVSIPATGVTIDRGETAAVAIGGALTLTATVTPEGSTDTVTWSSGDTATARVDASSGVVSGVAAGDAVITARAGSASDTIIVTVKPPVPATGVEITGGESAAVVIGGSITLHARVTPEGSTDQVVWSSSDDTKATVDALRGVVTGIAAGDAVITATAGNVSDTIIVTVQASGPETSITIDGGETAAVAIGGARTLTATVTPEGSTDIVWSSNAPATARVDASSGEVTGVAAGDAVITARAGSASDTITVTVKPPVPATGIRIDQGNYGTLAVGNTLTLTATVTPADSTDQVVWSSGNNERATVDALRGVVTGVGTKAVEIHARAGSASATITITVSPRIAAAGITINEGETAEVVVGDTLALHATKTPGDSTDQVVWSSGNTATAAVDASGVVTGKAEGTVTITAKAGDKTAAIEITVQPPKPPEPPKPLTWTEAPVSGFSNIYSIAYGGGKFVAVGCHYVDSQNKATMAWSDNGKTWTVDNLTSIFGSNIIYGIAYGSGKFVAVGDHGKMAYSGNGVNWTAVSNSTFGDDPITGIAYGRDTYSNDIFVAVSPSGKEALSSDGVTWTASSDTQTTISDIVYGGGKFVGYNDGRMALSGSGNYWSAVGNSTFKSGIYDITYGGEKFVAVGYDFGARIAYSGNGSNWTAVSLASIFGANTINGIAYGGGRFVAVGSGGKTASSSNGETWSALSDSRFDISYTNGIVYDGKKFVAVGYNLSGLDSFGKIMYSDDQE
jgi:uncharacterized protein YjdB